MALHSYHIADGGDSGLLPGDRAALVAGTSKCLSEASRKLAGFCWVKVGQVSLQTEACSGILCLTSFLTFGGWRGWRVSAGRLCRPYCKYELRNDALRKHWSDGFELPHRGIGLAYCCVKVVHSSNVRSVLRTFCAWALSKALRVEEIAGFYQRIVPILGADTSFETRPSGSFQYIDSLHDRLFANLRMKGIAGFYRGIVPPLL
jgi:hypothetical protein